MVCKIFSNIFKKSKKSSSGKHVKTIALEEPTIQEMVSSFSVVHLYFKIIFYQIVFSPFESFLLGFMNQNWYANILYCSLSNTHTHMPILIRLFSYAKQSIFSILTGHRWIAMYAEKLQPSVEKDKFSAEQTTWHGKKDCKTREIQQILSQISDRQTSSNQQKVSKVDTAAGALSQRGSCETWKSQDGTDLQHHFIIDQGV